MALIKMQGYLVKNALKMFYHSLKVGQEVYNAYAAKQIGKIELTFMDGLKGLTKSTKWYSQVNYFTVLDQLLIDKQLDIYSYSAIVYSAKYTEQMLDLVCFEDIQDNETLLLDGWGYGFVKYFIEDEYKALLEAKPDVKH